MSNKIYKRKSIEVEATQWTDTNDSKIYEILMSCTGLFGTLDIESCYNAIVSIKIRTRKGSIYQKRWDYFIIGDGFFDVESEFAFKVEYAEYEGKPENLNPYKLCLKC